MSFPLSHNEYLSLLHSHIVECCLLILLALVIVYQIYFYIRYIRKGGILSNSCTHQNSEQTDALPGVSVVVCARNEQKNLKEYLHTLLNQSYPRFEVIVVNDGSEDDTQLILEQYEHQYKNLYHTFVPREARVISSKKLALTIGIKASNYDYILLTDADCRPESKYWIREMMNGFSKDNIEVVLGFSPYFQKKGLLNKLISYDTLFCGLQYMGMAKAGYPYMGVGRNLAYRKSTFFANHGFQGLLNERAGDDDLFVNKVANRTNTAVVCNRYSITWTPPKSSWQEWLHQKRRHLSVSSHYKQHTRLQIGLEPLTRGLMYTLLIACLIIGGWRLVSIALGLFLIRLIVQLITINTAAHKLRISKFGLGIILYDILLPLITLSILIAQPMHKQSLYW